MSANLPSLRRHGLSPRRTAFFAERLRGGVFAVAGNSFFNLASGNAHDVDRVADYIGGAAFALWNHGA
jgi:hypothetical protein